MSRMLLPVATQGDLCRIHELVEQAGIQVEATTDNDTTVYVCRKDSARAIVSAPMHKEIVRDRHGRQVQDFYPVSIAPHSGLFRWLVHGGEDRRLQQNIAVALKPIVMAEE